MTHPPPLSQSPTWPIVSSHWGLCAQTGIEAHYISKQNRTASLHLHQIQTRSRRHPEVSLSVPAGCPTCILKGVYVCVCLCTCKQSVGFCGWLSLLPCLSPRIASPSLYAVQGNRFVKPFCLSAEKDVWQESSSAALNTTPKSMVRKEWLWHFHDILWACSQNLSITLQSILLFFSPLP